MYGAGFPGDTPPPLASGDENVIEFQSDDDAWYDVNLRLDGDVLKVFFRGFPNDSPWSISSVMFTSSRQLTKFRRRFRRCSIQVQDSECLKMEVGTKVCCSYCPRPDDLRYYDAIVTNVFRGKHMEVDDVGECDCFFCVRWLNGPKNGQMSEATVSEICWLAAEVDEVHPILNSFCMQCLSQFATVPQLPKKRHGALRPIRITIKKKGTTKPTSNNCIFIDNLETDLVPWSIVQFIHKNTSIHCEAYICPVSGGDVYARGVIFVERKIDFEKLFDFLCSPSYMIVSDRGRPWIVDKNWIFASSYMMGGLFKLSQKDRQIIKDMRQDSEALKRVKKGSLDYELGHLLKKNFSVFQYKLNNLLLSLAEEQKNILAKWKTSTSR